MSDFIYLDYNATAPLRPESYAAMLDAFQKTGNPYSAHQWGRQARHLLEQARQTIAALIHAEPQQIIFTSGGTEANNLALQGLSGLMTEFFFPLTEHDSIRKIFPHFTPLPVNSDGLLKWDEVTSALSQATPPFLVSVMLAHHETGVIQDIASLASVVHQHGGYLHTDAVQAAGKIAIDFKKLGADMISLSAHKMGGPMGIGALVVQENIPLFPLLRGGGQEKFLRAGTPSSALAAGFAAAFGAAEKEKENCVLSHQKLESYIQALCPQAVIFGQNAPRLLQTTCVSMPFVPQDFQVIAFDLEGIGISAGAACTSGKMHPSAALTAMGFSNKISTSAIRISSGWNTKSQQLEQAALIWEKIYKKAA